MSANSEELSATGYITHHLTHWATGKQKDMVDFSVFHVDTIFWSLFIGLLGVFVLWLAARKATSGVPGRFQAAVEFMVELVERESKSIIRTGNRAFIAPLALTVFVWVVLLNAMDFLPVDLFAGAFALFGIHIEYFRVVATADLNGTLGIALGVLALCLYYNVKIKGVGGFVHELFCTPFGANPILWPFNFVLNLIEFVSKTVSMAMRLFGNMYAGELLFLLLALLSGMAPWWGSFLHAGLGTLWAIFHILIVILQGFIFMMLTLVYIGQAHDSH